MFERGTQREALELIEIALEACPIKQSLTYAHLLNSKMMSYFKLNELKEARKALQESKSIREMLLDPADEDLAATYSNLGNIEAGEGNLDLGIQYHLRAMRIRKERPGAEVMTAIGHMCIGRILFWKGQHSAAAEAYKRCDQIFSEKLTPENFLMIG